MRWRDTGDRWASFTVSKGNPSTLSQALCVGIRPSTLHSCESICRQSDEILYEIHDIVIEYGNKVSSSFRNHPRAAQHNFWRGLENRTLENSSFCYSCGLFITGDTRILKGCGGTGGYRTPDLRIGLQRSPTELQFLT